MATLIALLRGINVGGNKTVPMDDLRDVAARLGFGAPATYVMSGNLAFTTKLKPEKARLALEEALQARFGFTVDVVVRTAEEWAEIAAGNPFPDAARERPNLLHVALARVPIGADVEDTLHEIGKAGERVKVVGDVLWLDFSGGVGKSKITPDVLNRVVGAPVTGRSIRTVEAIAELLREVTAGTAKSTGAVVRKAPRAKGVGAAKATKGTGRTSPARAGAAKRTRS